VVEENNNATVHQNNYKLLIKPACEVTLTNPTIKKMHFYYNTLDDYPLGLM